MVKVKLFTGMEDYLSNFLICTGKPRIGVLTKEEKALGFVFIDHKSSLTCLRHAIEDQVSKYFILYISAHSYAQQ